MDSTTPAHAVHIRAKRRLSPAVIRENVYGYLFLAPWLIGFLGLFLGPALASLRFSFTQYDVLSPAKWIGAGNYVKMFTDDNLFYTSLARTGYFTLLSVPLGVIGSMILAISSMGSYSPVTIPRSKVSISRHPIGASIPMTPGGSIP